MSNFYRFKRNKDGLRSICKQCWNDKTNLYKTQNPEKIKEINKKAVLKSRYGLSYPQLEAMKISQNNVCAICSKHKRLVVDHCHSSGKVRGLLCNSCNTSIGKFQDNPDICRIAAKYLEKN